MTSTNVTSNATVITALSAQTVVTVSYRGQSVNVSFAVTENISGMTLTFNDEFMGNSINEDNWDFQIGMGSQGPTNPWGNRELQFYRRENAETRNDNLVINVRRENIIFRWYGPGSNRSEEIYVTTTPLDELDFSTIPGLENYTQEDVTVLTSGASAGFSNAAGLFMSEFSSTRMRTANSFNQMFGRFEARISLPPYNGMWPAFWMMPERNTIAHGGWPRNGEIDIMEARGRVPNRVAQAVHFGAGTSSSNHTRHRWMGRSPDFLLPEGQTIRDFIIYRVDWHPDRIEWYVDDYLVMTLPIEDWRTPPGWRPYGTDANHVVRPGWGDIGAAAGAAIEADGRGGINTAFLQRPDRPGAPFDHPFHMILNVAVGGWYDSHLRPRDVNEYNEYGEILHSRFEHGEKRVDWVRGWQFDEYLDWYFCFETNTPQMGQNG